MSDFDFDSLGTMKKPPASPIGPFPGMTSLGNIDLDHRPLVKNPDGSTSTVRSMSVDMDGNEVLLPTVSDDGTVMDNDTAIDQYRKTGKNLGSFKSPEDADRYAGALHKSQSTYYGLDDQGGDFDIDSLPSGDQVDSQGIPVEDSDQYSQEDIQRDLNAASNDPSARQKEIDQNNDVRLAGHEYQPELPVKSAHDLYDNIKAQDKYKPLNDFENSLMAKTIGYDNTFSPTGLMADIGYSMPPELRAMKEARDAEMQNAYLHAGQDDTFKPSILGHEIDTGIPIRTQERIENNPDFKPGMPDDQAMTKTKYLVDPPDRDALTRMAYQVFRNIGTGIGDAVTEGKLLQEGSMGKSFPQTVPSETGEKFTTDMTTFILGPKVIGGAVGAAAKGVMKGAGAVAETSGLAAKAANIISPESKVAIQNIYTNTLKSTGSVQKAIGAAQGLTKRVLIGAGFGLSEATVAPQGSQGMLVSPEAVTKYMGVSPERAKDVAFMMDTPIVSGTLGTLGWMYRQVRDKGVAPAFGGLRNLEVFGVNPINNRLSGKLTMSEQSAGLKVVTWLDPNIIGASPEDAAFRIKVLGDSIARNATKNIQLGKTAKEIKIDTPAAFAESSKDYFRTAYGHLKEAMGEKEFNDWVDDQATRASNRLFELRTSAAGGNISAGQAKTSADLEGLLTEASDEMAGGSLPAAQESVGQIAEGTMGSNLQAADASLSGATAQRDVAKSVSDNAIMADPEMNKMITDAQNLGTLGSNKKFNESIENLSGPVYDSLKTLKGASDEAYKAIADTGVTAYPGPLLGIIKDSGHVDNPILTSLAEKINSDPSVGNIYNKVKNDITQNINTAEKSGDPQGILKTLYDLRQNIAGDQPGGQLDLLSKNGDPEVAALTKTAKENYIKYITAFDQHLKPMGAIKDAGETRLGLEKMNPGVGPGQGVEGYRSTANNVIKQNLNAEDGGIFMGALSRAAKAGGKNIDPTIDEVLTTKAISNIADKIATGGTQDISTLRSSVRDLIGGLQQVNSPFVGKLQNLESSIQTAQNVYKDKQQAFDTVKRQVDDLYEKAKDDALGKFMFKNGVGMDQSGVAAAMDKMFKSSTGSNQVKALLARADELPEGSIIKDAMRGSYLRYVREKIKSGQELGIAGIDNGNIVSGNRANVKNIKSMEAEGSRDQAIIEALYKDEPTLAPNLAELNKSYVNMTKRTPASKNDVLDDVPDYENPEQGMGSLIVYTMGTLNKRASRARRITGPLSIDKLRRVKEARNAVLMTFLSDPKGAGKIAEQVSKGVLTDAAKRDWSALMARGAARAYVTDDGKDPTLEDDMNDLK